jgi:hypothetical protein
MLSFVPDEPAGFFTVQTLFVDGGASIRQSPFLKSRLNTILDVHPHPQSQLTNGAEEERNLFEGREDGIRCIIDQGLAAVPRSIQIHLASPFNHPRLWLLEAPPGA